MKTQPDAPSEVAEALGRALVYRLLTDSLAFPANETRALLRLEVFPPLASMRTGSADFDQALRAVIATHDAPLDQSRREHGLVFTHIDSPDCPPYESAFCPGDVFRKAEVMADIAAFFHAHGLRTGGRDRERPDHIITQLDFMAFMARKQAHALAALGSDEVEECVGSQRRFLQEHLGCWGPAFAARLQLVASGTPFEAVGRLLEFWLDEELLWLDVHPVNRWIDPQPMPAPDDGLCGVEGLGPVDTPVELTRR